MLRVHISFVLSISVLVLSACAGSQKPAAISYDSADFKPATVEPVSKTDACLLCASKTK